MLIDAKELLNQLEWVVPGLDKKELIEQSSCFVFRDGKVWTFNDEIACSVKCDLKVEGVVFAEDLMKILRSLKDDKISIDIKQNKLLLQAKQARGATLFSKDILLPIDVVEVPKGWRPLPEEFIDGLKLVHTCASRKSAQAELTYVHIHPEYIEACDGVQAGRYLVAMPMKNPFLVEESSLRHILTMSPKKIGLTPRWVHFRNAAGFTISCRRNRDVYENLGELFDVKGEPFTIPKGLKDDISIQEWLASRTDDHRVLVTLEKGYMLIRADTSATWWVKRRRVHYDGPRLTFLIDPKLLVAIAEQFEDCEITDKRLLVNCGRLKYVTALGVAG